MKTAEERVKLPDAAAVASVLRKAMSTIEDVDRAAYLLCDSAKVRARSIERMRLDAVLGHLCDDIDASQRVSHSFAKSLDKKVHKSWRAWHALNSCHNYLKIVPVL